MNALAEVLPVAKGISFSNAPKDPHVNIHRITWSGLDIPLVSADFSHFAIKGEPCEKIVILHALFSKHYAGSPFFGLYVNGKVWRETLTPETIKWVNEEKKIANIIKDNVISEVIIIDLFAFSKEIENLIP